MQAANLITGAELLGLTNDRFTNSQISEHLKHVLMDCLIQRVTTTTANHSTWKRIDRLAPKNGLISRKNIETGPNNGFG